MYWYQPGAIDIKWQMDFADLFMPSIFLNTLTMQVVQKACFQKIWQRNFFFLEECISPIVMYCKSTFYLNKP